jgi:hypothetical protein
MERAAFLIDETGERIPCLLNPASVVLRRVSGVAPRTAGGPVTGPMLSDAPLAFTGGGWTELSLDLLFDVSLVAAPDRPGSVRELTEPLWKLAENHRRGEETGRPPLVRFVWGRSWNIPGVIAAIAERLEYFTVAGAPRRSWIRLRLLRVLDRTAASELDLTMPPEPSDQEPWVDWPTKVPEQDVHLRDLIAGAEGGDRVDLIAQEEWRRPSLWRRIAEFNDLDDPLRLEADTVLRIPPLGVEHA